jgi:hypothetical protein
MKARRFEHELLDVRAAGVLRALQLRRSDPAAYGSLTTTDVERGQDG